MDLDSELAQELERAIPHLTTAPASSHLSAGRRARRRRHAYAGVAGVAALALTTGAAVAVLGGSNPTGSDGTIADPPSASSTEIPSWAQEYGKHGPVSIYPDGRLWVAPDARLIKTVENPLGTEHEDVVSSYAVEAEMDGEVDWVLVYRDSDDDAVFGEMGHPGEWTNDFEMWIDDVTANAEDRQSCPSGWCTSPATVPNGWSRVRGPSSSTRPPTWCCPTGRPTRAWRSPR